MTAELCPALDVIYTQATTANQLFLRVEKELLEDLIPRELPEFGVRGQ